MGGSSINAFPPKVDGPVDRTDSLRWLIVIAAMIGSVLEVLDTSITNVAIPQMQGNLGATLSQIAWVNTGYIISNVIVLPMTGWLSQRFGQRRYFAASVALFTAASVMCGLSHDLAGIIFWRVVQGLGGGGLLSTGQVILLQAFPPAQQGVATAIFGMGVMVGPSIGPVLGGYLTDNYSWPAIFFINVPFGIAAAVMTWLFVPEAADGHENSSAIRRAERVDWQGFLLLAIGMGSLQTVLERGQEEDWFTSNFIISFTITAVVGLIAFVWWELRVKNPIVDLRVLRSRPLWAGSLMSGVVGVGLYATVFLLPVYLQQSQGYSAYQSGMILLPSALVSMLSFMIVGPLTQKLDARFLVAIGITSFALGALGLTQLTTQSGNSDVFWPLILRGLSLGFLFIPLTVAALAALRTDQVSTGSGFVNLSRQLGGSIGIAAFSTLLVRRASFHQSMLIQYVNCGNFPARDWLAGAQAVMVRHGMGFVSAHAGAMASLAGIVQHQALMLSFNDAYVMIGISFLATLPLLLMFRPGIASAQSTEPPKA